MHDVGQVLSLGQGLLLAVDGVALGLLGPIAAAAFENEVFVEAPLGRSERHLAPFAHASRGVAGLLHDGGDHDFAFRIDGLLAAVAVQCPCPKRMHRPVRELAPRRSAQRGGVGILKPRAAGRQRVDIRSLERAPVAMDVPNADVVGKDEEDIGLCGRRPAGSAEARATACVAAATLNISAIVASLFIGGTL